MAQRGSAVWTQEPASGGLDEGLRSGDSLRRRGARRAALGPRGRTGHMKAGARACGCQPEPGTAPGAGNWAAVGTVLGPCRQSRAVVGSLCQSAWLGSRGWRFKHRSVGVANIRSHSTVSKEDLDGMGGPQPIS